VGHQIKSLDIVEFKSFHLLLLSPPSLKVRRTMQRGGYELNAYATVYQYLQSDANTYISIDLQKMDCVIIDFIRKRRPQRTRSMVLQGIYKCITT